ncbi:MAG TPA: hypothetical protein VNT79_01670 [Phycisphaerae bacterium]|nr:hypothetical protein [Phycisphaerae bacterium]
MFTLLSLGVAFHISSAANPPPTEPVAVTPACIQMPVREVPTSPPAPDDPGSPRGDISAIGTQYDVSHWLGTQNPTPGCFPAYDPGPGGPPDDIVTFGPPQEQTRRLVNNTIPVISENEMILDPAHSQLTIQSQAPQPLFPGGQIGPQGQPLTDGCFFIGLSAPLAYDGPKTVTNAVIRFMVNGTPIMPPIDVTPMFSNPWDGTFGIRVPGLAGSPVNSVALDIFLSFDIPCVPPCDDGDPCTDDECVDGECIFAPIDCSDSDPCTTDEHCEDGECVSERLDCDDGNPCTVDFCEGAGCINEHLKDILSREEALRASHGPLAPCFESGGGLCPPPVFTEPRDAWETNDDCDGHTKWRIGLDPGSPAIPEDFFDPGSEPFTGEVFFKGAPLGLPGLANTDTLVRRSDDPFGRNSPPDGTEITVEIELIQLSLVSCQPITVQYDGGAFTVDWDISVSLSDCPPPPGSLTATKTHCNGGTFESVLPVQPKLTFTRVDNPSVVRVLDSGCDAPTYPPDLLGPATPIAWVHDIASNLSVAADYGSSFHAGLPLGQSTCCGDYDLDGDADGNDFQHFLRAYGHATDDLGCQYYYIDYDVDGVIDFDDYTEWLACYRCSTGDPDAGPPSPGIIGDLNEDGSVRGNDIEAWIDCFLASSATDPCDRADTDQNGTTDLDDVPGLVLLLLELE